MNENEINARDMMSFEERENRRIQSKGEPKHTGRSEFLFKTVTAQFIVGALILAALFFMRSSSPKSFEYFKDKFNSLMKRDITFEEMASAFKSVSAAAVGDSPAEQAVAEAETTERSTPEEVPDASGGEDLLKAQNKTTFSPVVVSQRIIAPLDEYTVTSRFGYRVNPISGKHGFHTGLDMAAAEGTEIKAAYSGIVIDTGVTDVKGNYVVLEHSDNTVTEYYHCKEILCEIDDNVRQGQTIALVGSTGWSTGPHLHFEVLINGVNCNPEFLLDEIKD